MTAQTEWDVWFAWLDGEHPVSDNRKPLADFECRKCGQLDCECERKSWSK